jgi:hypothetical protein
MSSLTKVNSLKVKSLRPLIKPRKKWMPTDFRILLLPSFKVFLRNLPNFLINHLSILLIAYPITECPPGLVHPQLPKVILTAHVARLHLCYSMDDLEYVADVEEVQEFIWRWLDFILEKLIELECGLHTVL